MTDDRSSLPRAVPWDPDGPRAVLWDLDGTLADSSERHWEAWRDAMAAINRSLTRAQFDASFGQRNDRFLRLWLGDDVPDADIVRFGEDKEAAYRRIVEAEGLAALPGATEWVRRLRTEGWLQAIASSAPRSNIEVMVKALGLDGAIDTFVGAEDVTRGKPEPDVFLAAAERLGVPPVRCIVVEDAAVGVEAARRAGMHVVGVNAATPLEADIFVRSLNDLQSNALDGLLV
jgi:beta-phosphoglucomutase